MVRELADGGLEKWLLTELPKARERVTTLRERWPSDDPRALARRLIDDKKKWARAGGAVSGLFGLATLPADLAFVAWLQVGLIVEIAVANERHMKSARAREEVIDIFVAANGLAGPALRASPKAVARVAETLLVKRGMRLLGRLVPVVSAPVSAFLNDRDIERAGLAAIRHYTLAPLALEARRAASGT